MLLFFMQSNHVVNSDKSACDKDCTVLSTLFVYQEVSSSNF